MENKNIKLMTHQIIGYPNIDLNYQVLKKFEDAGVEVVELQIPFSEPVADGPLFVKSNQLALEGGMTVAKAIEFMERVCKEFSFDVYVMTYYNIVYKYGEERFFEKMKSIGIKGAIVPDIPVEESSEFFVMAKKYGIYTVPIITPFTDDERMKKIMEEAKDFVYYVPRTGVTGSTTQLTDSILDKIDELKSKINIPVAVGFGIQSKEAVSKLTGHADIAILGSHLQRILEEKGVDELGEFVAQLR